MTKLSGGLGLWGPLALVSIATLAWLVALSSDPDGLMQRPPGEGRRDDPHGRYVAVPEQLPAQGLRDVVMRVWNEVSDDRVTLIAAGVTFYLLLALFPALAALVSLYALVADPLTISEHLRDLAALLPPGAFDLVADQIQALAHRQQGALSIAFGVGLAVALWSTHNGALAIFDAMNVAYEETEKRGFVKRNLIALVFTLCAIVSVGILVATAAVLPLIFSYIWLDRFQADAVLISRWPLLFICAFCAVMAIYRFAPSREPPRLRWMTWGAVTTTVGWFAMSIAFAIYLDRFANYNATYGTLGALIGLLMWTWLSVTILIVGAELNAELEHQTEIDTTTGKPLLMGSRGAYMADTIGKAAE
ncbi:YihY/virulence factor BrkB family protein [Rhizobium sp. BK376]|uniref:YihY/virulence factor BrkB family protein n=1 Tax=Rhizobium sp. BK376 TaxID=2512149 RepID=UPI00104516F8|nr:YihY/virulence factor BrkB family protein [Rhizobium sp. BK376]TCR71056.1 membrane protein [Rhizobium sp. BK376]